MTSEFMPIFLGQGCTPALKREPPVVVRQRCYDIICQELSFEIFSDASRNFFAEMAGAMLSHAEPQPEALSVGVVLPKTRGGF